MEAAARSVSRRFVIVSGLPGSGKTTVARALAPLMNLPVVDKDEILERLFESRGIGDFGWRRALSREADVILHADVSASVGAIVSSFWHVPGMPTDSGTPTDWLDSLSGVIVNVHCECPPAVAADRFLRRTRHAGHLDGTRSAADVHASIDALAALGSLGIGEPVLVDTTLPIDGVALLRDVNAAMRHLG